MTYSKALPVSPWLTSTKRSLYTHALVILSFFHVVVQLSSVEVGTKNEWYRSSEFDHVSSFAQQTDDGSEPTQTTPWIVKFKDREDLEAASLCDELSNPCRCERGDSGHLFGLVFLTCRGTQPTDLVAFLETMEVDGIRVEVDRTFFGGDVRTPSVQYTSEAICDGSGRFDGFPQTHVMNWGLDRCDQDTALLNNEYDVKERLTGCGVHLYIMDSGIYAEHEDFAGRIREGWSVMDRSPNGADDNGHGTHCMGIAAGRKSGVAKDAFLHGVKVLDTRGSATSSRVFEGLEWIYRDIVHNKRFPAVLSMSIAAPGEDVTLNEIMKLLYDAGVVVVVAAGNYETDACAFTPANSNHVLTVGATEIDKDREDVRATFSNFGPCVDVWAPGRNIVSSATTSNTSYVKKSGTSMAAPFVADVAALYLQNHRNATPGQVYDAIKAGFTRTPTIVTKEKSSRKFIAPPLMCNINGLKTCQHPIDCQVSAKDDWSSCPRSGSVCGQHLQVRHYRIDQTPKCGGAHCPNLTQYKDCADSNFSYVPCDHAVPAQWILPDDLHLQHRIWNLTPIADDAYTSCFSSNSRIIAPENPFSRSRSLLTIPDDSSVEYLFPAVFRFFGREYRSVHVGSNGYLTFGSGDFRYAIVPKEKPLNTAPRIEAYEAVLFDDHYPEKFFAQATTFTAQQPLALTDTHWAKPRISAWFQDLDPSTGAAQVSVDVIEDAKVVISYQDVLCWNAADASETSTFQIILWLEGSENAGKIQVWWGDLTNDRGAVVGLSPGFRPTDWQSTNLNDSAECDAPSPPLSSPSHPSAKPELGQTPLAFSLFS